MHVDQKLVAGNAQNDPVEVEIGLGIGGKIERSSRLTKSLDAVLQLLDFLFCVVDRGELGGIALHDIAKLVDLAQRIPSREAP